MLIACLSNNRASVHAIRLSVNNSETIYPLQKAGEYQLKSPPYAEGNHSQILQFLPFLSSFCVLGRAFFLLELIRCKLAMYPATQEQHHHADGKISTF